MSHDLEEEIRETRRLIAGLYAMAKTNTDQIANLIEDANKRGGTLNRVVRKLNAASEVLDMTKPETLNGAGL